MRTIPESLNDIDTKKLELEFKKFKSLYNDLVKNYLKPNEIELFWTLL
jgi:hypothetical protein